MITIGERNIGPNAPVFIIAEAGVNHNGELNLAKKLVDAAVAAGADAIKFQSFKAHRVASIKAPKAEYQLALTNNTESQLEMLQNLELSPEAHYELKTYCHKQGLLFISTPFDRDSADLLNELDVPLFKVGSGEITNWSFLEYLAQKQKPIILSTGMSYLSEVDEAVRVLHRAGCDRLILLHCVSNYPAYPADINLRAIQTLSIATQVPVGYSDHTPGIEVALAAVALGACVIEKHFTLDRTLSGPDHQASLEPDQFQALVTGIRTVESALGNGIKQPAQSEMSNRLVGRRSLAAAIDIPQGTVLKPTMLQALRPATGIAPTLKEQVIGRRIKRPLASGQIITWDDLQ